MPEEHEHENIDNNLPVVCKLKRIQPLYKPRNPNEPEAFRNRYEAHVGFGDYNFERKDRYKVDHEPVRSTIVEHDSCEINFKRAIFERIRCDEGKENVYPKEVLGTGIVDAPG